MDSSILKLMILISVLMTTTSRTTKEDSSDESIENLLYYKDCNRKPNKVQPKLLKAPEKPPPQPACPCPRMCCSMCCDCSSNNYLPGQPTDMYGRQAQTLQQQTKLPTQDMTNLRSPEQTVSQNQYNHDGPSGSPEIPQFDAPLRPQTKPIFPIRRDLSNSFTKEHIKSLINHDEDIKKILKELVAVTVNKADLMNKLKARYGQSPNNLMNAWKPYNSNNDENYQDSEK